MENKQKINLKIEESFPFKPYHIQIEFSRNLYESLSNKKLCIFESPTGTGKSLSLICGAFNWMKDNQDNYDIIKKFKEKRDQINSEVDSIFKKEDSHSLPAWMKNVNDVNKTMFSEKLLVNKNKLLQKSQSLKNFLMFRKEKMKIKYEEYQKNQQQKRNNQANQQPTLINQKDNDEIDEDQQFCVNWSENSQENEFAAQIEDYKKFKTQNINGNKYMVSKQDEDQNEVDRDLQQIKIIYASRTHSQIKQFVEEILKTKFKDMRIITLGSRQNLCINKNIDSSKHTLNYIDDYCQKAIGINKSDKTIPKCEYYTNLKILETEIDYLFLESIHTIDQMRSSSLNNQVCPYYLSKKSITDAEVICVPYVTLLDEKMRESSNIDITNAIIIFDESHNILESLSGIHSAEVSCQSIFAAFMQLLTYYDKFCRRLNPKNALFIQNIKNLCLELIKYIKSEIENNKSQSSNINYIKIDNISLLLKLNMDRIDFFSIKKFTEDTRLGQKIHFYSKSPKYVSSNIPAIVQKLIKDTNLNEQIKSSEYMVVDKVMTFLWKMQDSINKSEKYSIILKNIDKLENSCIQILCLDVIEPLRKVVEESACVVLAGGTMEPLSEFELLINQIGKDNYFNFSCGHVIDEDNCQAYCVSTLHDNDQSNIIFNYQNKKDNTLLNTSINIISKLAVLIPDGLVFFVQSYSFLEKLREALLKDEKSLNQIQSYKKIFMDERENSNNSLLERYQKEIDKERNGDDKKNGAILISVIGGKLSEGINFSDKLARCVVVLGMPYSNIKSAELIEKMNHYDKINNKTKGNFSGNDYYENLCMKSVNQAIGRSIRHKNDYAVILLVDQRFSFDKNIKRLSGWIREKVQIVGSFDKAQNQIQTFFKNKS